VSEVRASSPDDRRGLELRALLGVDASLRARVRLDEHRARRAGRLAPADENVPAVRRGRGARVRLPLFDEPEAPPAPVPIRPRILVNSPEYCAWWDGFRVGAAGVPIAGLVDVHYRDGHRIGALFSPLPCTKGER
jgi:hypothetical protein